MNRLKLSFVWKAKGIRRYSVERTHAEAGFETLDELVSHAKKTKNGSGRAHVPNRYNRLLGWICVSAVGGMLGFAFYRNLYERKQPYPRSVRKFMRRALCARYLGGTNGYITNNLLNALDRLRDLGYGTSSKQFVGVGVLLAEILEDRGAYVEAIPILENAVSWAAAGTPSTVTSQQDKFTGTLQETFSLEEFLPEPQQFDSESDKLHMSVRLMQKIGDLYWLKLNNPTGAEPCYAWSLKTLLGWKHNADTSSTFSNVLNSPGAYPTAQLLPANVQTNESTETPSMTLVQHVDWIGSAELVSTIEKLASLYASDAVNKPELAIPLYYRCAQLLASPQVLESKTTLLKEDLASLREEFQSRIGSCRKCIVMNNLAECYTRLGKPIYYKEAEKWLRASIGKADKEIASILAGSKNSESDLSDCMECKAIGYFNLGAVLELSHSIREAKSAYRNALQACDVAISKQKTDSLLSCKETTEKALSQLESLKPKN